MDNLVKPALADGCYIAYTHGSCRPNPGPGGCAYRLYGPGGAAPSKGSRKSCDTTNNIAELQAVIDALQATPAGACVQVCLDSKYIKDGFEGYLSGWSANGWKKTNGKDVANRQQWELIQRLAETREVTFRKVHRDAGDPDFEQVHQLAVEAAVSATRRGPIASPVIA